MNYNCHCVEVAMLKCNCGLTAQVPMKSMWLMTGKWECMFLPVNIITTILRVSVGTLMEIVMKNRISCMQV